MAESTKKTTSGSKQSTKPGPGLPSKQPGKESGKGRVNLPTKKKT
jgi:hypothetical protein